MRSAANNIKRSWVSENTDRVPIARKPSRYPIRSWEELVGTDAPIPVVARKNTAADALTSVDRRGDEGARRVAAILHVRRTGTKDVELAHLHRRER